MGENEKRGRRSMGRPNEAWLKRLNENIREKPAQELLKTLQQCGCNMDDILYFLYEYCAWDHCLLRQLGHWRSHLVSQYQKAEKALEKVARALEQVNNCTYLTRVAWAEIVRECYAGVCHSLGGPGVVLAQENGQAIGFTPGDLILNLPDVLRLSASHHRTVRLEAAKLMSPRRLGRNYVLVELYWYLRCVTGKVPSRSQIALLLGAALNEPVEPELVAKNIKNFQRMNPWLYRDAEQRFSEYARYRILCLKTHKPVRPYFEWHCTREATETRGARRTRSD